MFFSLSLSLGSPLEREILKYNIGRIVRACPCWEVDHPSISEQKTVTISSGVLGTTQASSLVLAPLLRLLQTSILLLGIGVGTALLLATGALVVVAVVVKLVLVGRHLPVSLVWVVLSGVLLFLSFSPFWVPGK
jgi:hypothetical protein